MRWVASTKDRVSVGSSPSGTIATMIPIAKMKSFQNGTPTIHPIAKTDQSDQKRQQCDEPAQSGKLASQR